MIKRLVKSLKRRLSRNFNIQYLYGFLFQDRYLNYKGMKKIFFLMVPAYGNIGDQALTYATMLYFEREFKDYEVIVVGIENVYRYMAAIKAAIEPGDLVAMPGGGNCGNLYMRIERLRRFIVRRLKDKGNQIISMPSTLSFTGDRKGEREREKSRRIFESNPNLILIAREKISYDMQREYYSKCKSLLCPDMAFYLWEQRPQTERRGIMLCLRSDKESVLKKKRDEIIRQLWDVCPPAFIFDTFIGRAVSHELRPYEVQSVFNLFSQHEIVVTDRLHGLILSVITNTPCIVLPSMDHKIRGTLLWLKDLSFVSYLEDLDIDRIKAEIARLRTVDSTQFIDFRALYFNHLRQMIEELR